MSEAMSLRDLATPVRAWLEYNVDLSPTLSRAFDDVSLGVRRPSTNSTVLEKIAVTLLASALPAAVAEFQEGLGPREHLLRLREVADFVNDVEAFARSSLQVEIATKLSFERIFPTAQAIFAESDSVRHILPSELIVLYKTYVSTNLVSTSFERFLLLAALEGEIRVRSRPMSRELSPETPASKESLVVDIFRVLGGSAVISFVAARIWAWFSLADQSFDDGYVAGWLFGRAFAIFIVLAALGVFGTIRVWSADYRARIAREDTARTFRRSPLIEMFEEGRKGTQTRLLGLAKASAANGAVLPDPVEALLQRAASRSPDDWLTS